MTLRQLSLVSTTFLLTGFLEQSECAYFDGYLPNWAEKVIPKGLRGPTGSSEEDSGEYRKDRFVRKKRIKHPICDELYKTKHKKGTQGGLRWLKKLVPWNMRLFCIIKMFVDLDTVYKFIRNVNEVVKPCRNRHPSRAHCRPNPSFKETLKPGVYIPPKDWTCYEKAMKSKEFYETLENLYEQVMPCFRNALDLDFEGREPTELRKDKNVNRWIHSVWWFWWYFMSDQVTFYLARSDGPDLESTVYDDDLFDNRIDPNHPTKIIIHGFVNDHNSSLVSTLRKAYMKPKKAKQGGRKIDITIEKKVDGEGDFEVDKEVDMEDDLEVEIEVESNVILVDWSSMTFDTYYTTRIRTIFVATVTVELLDRLEAEFEVDLTDVEMVGHSLGAQIAGLIGNLAVDVEYTASRSRKSRKKIGRITGLDASLPGFLLTPRNWRLTEDSATFVQAIHTSDYTFASAKRAGHVDFYVNSGLPSQPGCGVSGLLGWELPRNTLTTLIGITMNFDILCSHYRSITYYVESIRRPKAFKAQKCRNAVFFGLGLCRGNPTTYMGAGAQSNATPGSYYLNTASKKPFGLGKKGI